MILKSVSLTNFRNYSEREFLFSPETTLIVGPNTSGKTNLLEAVYFLATGRSFRANFDREVIRDSERFTQIKGVKGLKGVKRDEGNLEVAIVADQNHENISHKRFKVNGVKKRLADFVGNLRVVYFGPEEIELVTGTPSRRRRYLDQVLSQVDREYARASIAFEKARRQRNRLLWQIKERFVGEGDLAFWDGKILELGGLIQERREGMIARLNKGLAPHHVGYGVRELGIEYLPNEISKERMSRYRSREIAAGMTLWGPHRDDFRFRKNSENGSEQLRKLSESDGQNIREPDKSDISDTLTHRGTEALSYSDLSSFGSRGEQRLAVFHLKLAELEFIKERAEEYPVLLLDDIFSELDRDNRRQVLTIIPRQQTIITTTDLEVVGKGLSGAAYIMLRS